MKTKIGIFLLTGLLITASCSSNKTKNDPALRAPQSDLTQSNLFLEKVKVGSLPSAQRMGYMLEAKDSKFKGCVIYLEGLGDSIRNHDPLFNKLTNAGYRVLMFDYLGQGGSDGDMSSTRVRADGDPYPKFADYEIGEQARFVWKRYSDTNDPVYNRSCLGSPKRVIGWSTGGLAAYKLAYENWAEVIVMIAPGISPNPCNGEVALDNPSIPKCMARSLVTKRVISQRTLTTNRFENQANPHLDPIKPLSPLAAPEFAMNLLATAYLNAHFWKINPSVSGLTFFAGPLDTYADTASAMKVMKKNAPTIQFVTYPKALHEVDNEIPEIANDMHAKTIEFFDVH